MADEIGGKEFVDLIGKTDSSTGKSIGETILSIASGETKHREGFYGDKGSKARDVAETLARGRGFLEPVRQTSDQEIDRMMAEGTGLEVIRGADKQSLEDLTNENSINTPMSSYDEGGAGLYFAIEGASDKQIKDFKIEAGNTSNQYTSDHYASKVERAGREAGVMRAVIPSDAKIGRIKSEEYTKDVATRFERIEADLGEMEKAGQDVSRARSVLSAIKQNNDQNSSSDILSGYDAVTLQSNEVRLINRSAALSSGVKSREEMKQLYPETPMKLAADGSSSRLRGGFGTFTKKYAESMQDRHQMAVARHQSTKGIPVEEKTFLLHHSFTRDIPVGDAIRTTSSKNNIQTTATDAIVGHSYAWDAKTGLRHSVSNQVSAQGKGHTVYLTRADTKSVYPDLNVPGTKSRAIKGQQEVIDSVYVPAGMSEEEGKKIVSEMTGKHGIVHVDDTEDAVSRALLIEKGDEALANYKEGNLMTNVGGHINAIDRELASGKGLSPIYGPKSILPYLHTFARIYQSEGREAAIAHALENSDKFTIETHQKRYDLAKTAIEAAKSGSPIVHPNVIRSSDDSDQLMAEDLVLNEQETETPDPPPASSSEPPPESSEFVPTPNVSDLRAQLGIKPEKESEPVTLTPDQQKFIDQMKLEVRENQRLAEEALPSVKEAVQKEGYLYHFASTKNRESIAEKGLMPGQAQGPGKTFFYTKPEGHNITQFVNPDPMDIYRIKVTPEILENLKVDPLIRHSAVFVSGDLAKQGIKAERIGTNTRIAEDGTITYDKIQKVAEDVSKNLPVGNKTNIGTSVNSAKVFNTPQAAAQAEAVVQYATSSAALQDSPNVPNISAKSAKTKNMMKAVKKASAAVAGGSKKSTALRVAGAAATIFRRKT
jgi:hypothetical protein